MSGKERGEEAVDHWNPLRWGGHGERGGSWGRRRRLLQVLVDNRPAAKIEEARRGPWGWGWHGRVGGAGRESIGGIVWYSAVRYGIV